MEGFEEEEMVVVGGNLDRSAAPTKSISPSAVVDSC